MEWGRAVGSEARFLAWVSVAVCRLLYEGQSVFFITWSLPGVTRYCSSTHAPFLGQIVAPLSGVTGCNPIVMLLLFK